MGVPPKHPFLDGIFLSKPSSYWGTTIYGTPQIYTDFLQKTSSHVGGGSIALLLHANVGHFLPFRVGQHSSNGLWF